MAAPLPAVSQVLPQPFFPGVNGAAEAGTSWVLDPNIQPPHTDQFDFTIQRQITSRVRLEVGYVGRIMRQEQFPHFADLRRCFRSADQVRVASGKPVVVFNVCGNTYRLICAMHYDTGKVFLLRFFKVNLFPTIRFPLHDHARKELGWSNTQVLVRFLLLHLGVSALLVILVLKVR